MAEAAFKQMIATFVRQTRPQTFRYGKPPRYPQRSIATAAVVRTQPEEEQGQPEWQAHHLTNSDIPSLPKTRLRQLREETTPRPFSSFLTDNHSREHNYLRISLTERCNLRCIYCMPEEGIELAPPDHILTTPEIVYLSSLFVDQGVDKIRLTGGEPTVRKDILDLMHQIGQLRSSGLKELCLTTKGISLHRKLDSMVESGLTGVNLSLDTLDPFQFTIMTRRNGHEAVMKSIDRILEMNRLGAGIKLKVNCVVMRGINDREIIPFVELGRDKDLEVRFIEYMPFDGNKWSQKKMLSFEEMLFQIRQKYPDVRKVRDHANDTSKTYKIPGFTGRIGFITSMTHNFCGTCNRLRITSDGNLKVCLFGNSEVSLRDILREFNGGNPIDHEAMEALKQVESDRKQAIYGSTGALGVSEREARLLDVIGMAVKRKKAKHADDKQRAQTSHTAYRPHSPLRSDSPLLAVRSNTAFSKSIPTHLLPHTSQSSMFQQHRYRSTFLLRRTYITRKRLLRYIFHIPSYRPIDTDPSKKVTSRECVYEQQRNKRAIVDAVKLISRMSRFSTKGAWRRKEDDDKGANARPLTHLTSSGEAHMVDVGRKKETHRSATAVCHLKFSQPSTYQSLKLASIKKGDALAVARVAGIQAAKRTADLIPLAHPGLAITAVNIDIEAFPPYSKKQYASGTTAEKEPLDAPRGVSAAVSKHKYGGIRVAATVECWGKTGIEMESLTAANVATLTIYDMLKGIDKHMLITASRVIEKKGGKSGSWKWDEDNQIVEQLENEHPESEYSASHQQDEVEAMHMQQRGIMQATTRSEAAFPSAASPPDSISREDPEETTVNGNNAQSVFENEWKTLSSSFSTPSQEPNRTDTDKPPSEIAPAHEPKFTFSSPTREVDEADGRVTRVDREMLSGGVHTRADSSGFRKAREERYEEWRRNS